MVLTRVRENTDREALEEGYEFPVSVNDDSWFVVGLVKVRKLNEEDKGHVENGGKGNNGDVSKLVQVLRKR